MKTKFFFYVLLGVMTLGAMSSCGKSNSLIESEFDQIFYPEKGKLGLENILSEGFLEGKKTEWGIFEYSVKAVLPAGNSSLKIVIRSTKPRLFVCHNDLPSPPFHQCRAYFYEWYEICPECGGENSLKEVIGVNAWGGNCSGYDENWIISRWDNSLQGNTWTVYENDKPADAIVTLSNDFIIEYYENGAKEPTKVKEVKVID